MQTFRSLSEVDQAPLPPKLRRVVAQAVRTLLEAYGPDYDPEDCGYVVLVDQTTTDTHARDLMGHSWSDLLLEGAVYDPEAECFATCALANNDFGWTILAPDEPWLDPKFRAKLISELCPGGGEL